ncbi:histone-lysine N-methyltransferase 2D-like [Sycon ciliatum]|uniref:histone-lysine N-methyltransferase 2D-like n=1 Tax=Sycon ciliatum TaxID=27933 RepID=UPI0031F6955E
MGGGRPLLEGWLTKSPPSSGTGLKRWRKRWVVLLQSKVLEYYEDDKKSKQKGSVNLEDCIAIRTDLTTGKNKGKNMFCVETPSRFYYFCAESKQREAEWVAKMMELCNFPITEANARCQTMAGVSIGNSSRPISENTAAMNGSMTLPNSAPKPRSLTVGALNSTSSTPTAAEFGTADDNRRASNSVAHQTAPGSDYYLVGEGTDVTDVTDGPVPPPPSQPVENGVESAERLAGRVQSMHLGRPMTEHEMRALESYDVVPLSNTNGAARNSLRGGSMRHTLHRETSSSSNVATSPERYVDLPKAQSAAILMSSESPAHTIAPSPYQYPPPPRRANTSDSAGSSAPATSGMHVQPVGATDPMSAYSFPQPATSGMHVQAVPAAVGVTDPMSAYSYLPPPRAASTVSPEHQLQQPGDGQQQQPRPVGYALLGPDDLKAPPPVINRSSKPRTDSMSPPDPDAPNIDRSSKPKTTQSTQSTDLDGMEFEHIPVPTAGSKRFSRLGYYDIPPTAVTPMTMQLVTQYGASTLPVVSSRFSEGDPVGNYDIPPNFRPGPTLNGGGAPQAVPVHIVSPEQQHVLMSGQLGNVAIPLDTAFMMPGQYPQQLYNFDQLQPQQQQHAGMENVPMQNYDYPPGSSQLRHSADPNQHYDIPPPPVAGQELPPPSSAYDYPPPASSRASIRGSMSAGRMQSPESTYNFPPTPIAANQIPTANYSYLPPPVKAVSPDMAAYSVPPGVVPARPDKPVSLRTSASAPQFNPSEYNGNGAGPAEGGEMEYMVMGNGAGAAAAGGAQMDDQYTDMRNTGPSAADEAIRMVSGGPPPPRPPKPS